MKIGYLMIAGTAALTIGAAATAQTQQDPSSQSGRTEQQAQAGGMQQGMDSETLKQVQQTLNDKGHNAGPVDGIMGPKTQKGLKDFQKAQGMPETGRIDQQTLAALGIQGQSSVGASSQRDTAGSAAGASQPDTGTSGSAPGASQPKQEESKPGASGGSSQLPESSGGSSGSGQIPQSSESPSAGSSSMPSESGRSGSETQRQ